mgnify:CR=1 FL=1
MSNIDYGVCVTTRLLDTHQDKLDNTEYQFNDTYRSIVTLFLDQLTETSVQEDINDDLTFEIQVHIERYSYNLEVEDVATQIYKDFKIKGAE